MKKILAVLHTYNEKLGQYFSGTALGQLLSAIILAAAVACATSMADGIRQERAEADFYSQISLGNAQEYVEDTLGHPVYKHVWNEYGLSECRYLTKHAMVRVFYSDSIVSAFFITSRDQEYKKIKTTDTVSEVKPLGTYTYEMINDSPAEVQSYQNLFTGDFVYMEKYFEWGTGYYCVYGYSNYYGFDSNSYTTEEAFRSDEDIEDIHDSLVQLTVEGQGIEEVLFIDREKSYPNTYGKCVQEESWIFGELMENCSNY